MRKGQIHSQMLVYIASAIVVVLIIIFGIRTYGSFQKRQRDVIVIDLEEKLKSMIDLSSGEFGAIRKVELRVPSDVDKVCFVDLSKKKELRSSFIAQAYPEIGEILQDDAVPENVFLLSGNTITDALEAGNICLPMPYYVCINTEDNYLRFLIEGKEGCANIIRPIGGLTIHNTKNLNRYEEGLAFFAADGDEAESGDMIIERQWILQYIPITIWNDRAGGITEYPFFVYYENEIVTQETMAAKVNPSTRLRFAVSAPTAFAEECPTIESYAELTINSVDYYCQTEEIFDPTVYYSYWDTLEDVVVVRADNREGALMGTLFASYLIAPVIFVESGGTIDMTMIENKRVYIIDNLPKETINIIAANSKEMLQYGSNYLRINEDLENYRKIISNIMIVNND